MDYFSAKKECLNSFLFSKLGFGEKLFELVALSLFKTA